MSDRHLTVDELIRWREEGAGERDRIVGHLAVCDVCCRTAAGLDEPSPAVSTPLQFDPRDFAERGYRAHRPRVAVKAQWLVPLAAAAAIVLAVVLMPKGPDPVSAPAQRGPVDQITLVRPVAAAVTAGELVFEWSGSAASDRIRLRVFDLANPSQPVLERSVTDSRYAPTDEERGRLQRGREYHWFVERSVAGGPTHTSAAGRFTVR